MGPSDAEIDGRLTQIKGNFPNEDAFQKGIAAQGILRRSTEPGAAAPGAVELVARVERRPFAAQFQFDNRGSRELEPDYRA